MNEAHRLELELLLENLLSEMTHSADTASFNRACSLFANLVNRVHAQGYHLCIRAEGDESDVELREIHLQ